MISFSENIRRLRLFRDLTQTQMAKRCKLSQATIAHLEKGTKDPSLKTILKIAKALSVNPGDLISGKSLVVEIKNECI